MKVLILGSNGQLGSEIREIASNYKKFDCIFKDFPDLDIFLPYALLTFSS